MMAKILFLLLVLSGSKVSDSQNTDAPAAAVIVNSEDIPRGSSRDWTPFGWDWFPVFCGLRTVDPPFLSSCNEPIPEGLPDHRGDWAVLNDDGSIEGCQRIEQCGDRYTVTSGGLIGLNVIHDFPHVDGTYENGMQDYMTFLLPLCVPISVRGEFYTDENDRPCMRMRSSPLFLFGGEIDGAIRCYNGEDDTLFFDDAGLNFLEGGARVLTRADCGTFLAS